MQPDAPARSAEGDGHPADPVTVCICTFRRPALRQAIESVLRQEGVDPKATSVLVVDNDTNPSAEPLVRQVAAGAALPVRYLHAPERNISVARNAALLHAGTRWAAFIDDDETAPADWLRTLTDARHGNHAVVGQSVALYQPGTPRWAKVLDFHSNRITGRVDNAYTCNVLLDLRFVQAHALRFPEEAGQTGGEDTLFFRAMAGAGGRIAYRPEAKVSEEIGRDRANLRWVLRRRFRAGQTHGVLLSRFDPPAYRKLWLTAGAKAGACALMAAFTAPLLYPAVRWAARAALHLGALSYVLRRSVVAEYASPQR